jgi:hypothetical protein
MKKILIYILLGTLINGLFLSFVFLIKDRFFYESKSSLHVYSYLGFSALIFYITLSRINKTRQNFLDYYKSIGISMIIYLCSILVYRFVFIFLHFQHSIKHVTNWIFPFILYSMTGLIIALLISIFFMKKRLDKLNI